MEKLLTFFSIFCLYVLLMAAASVAQAGTKQEGWVTMSGDFGVNITGFADDGVSNISISWGKSKDLAIYFGFAVGGYHGHALRKVVELEQPFILRVRSVSGENEKFPLIAYMAGDGAWTQPRERGLTGDGISWRVQPGRSLDLADRERRRARFLDS
jgi:hypothetical protein